MKGTSLDTHTCPRPNDPDVLPGMTYRQWLIGMAMQAVLNAAATGEYSEGNLVPPSADDVAKHAIFQADAIMDVLKSEAE